LEGVLMKKFIDLDKKKNIVYDNIYFDKNKLVVKIPLITKEGAESEDLKVDRFDLARYTYLTAYE
jgi:hypothetical protein